MTPIEQAKLRAIKLTLELSRDEDNPDINDAMIRASIDEINEILKFYDS